MENIEEKIQSIEEAKLSDAGRLAALVSAHAEIVITRVQKGAKKYPSFNTGQYGLNLYISYQDKCAKELYNTVKDLTGMITKEFPDYTVIPPLMDLGTGMKLFLIGNPFLEWDATEQVIIKFKNPFINEAKKEIRFKCVVRSE